MRDKQRIVLIQEEIRKYWEKHPDLRLSQIVCNCSVSLGVTDPFYLEDDDLLYTIRKLNVLEE